MKDADDGHVEMDIEEVVDYAMDDGLQLLNVTTTDQELAIHICSTVMEREKVMGRMPVYLQGTRLENEISVSHFDEDTRNLVTFGMPPRTGMLGMMDFRTFCEVMSGGNTDEALGKMVVVMDVPLVWSVDFAMSMRHIMRGLRRLRKNEPNFAMITVGNGPDPVRCLRAQFRHMGIVADWRERWGEPCYWDEEDEIGCWGTEAEPERNNLGEIFLKATSQGKNVVVLGVKPDLQGAESTLATVMVGKNTKYDEVASLLGGTEELRGRVVCVDVSVFSTPLPFRNVGVVFSNIEQERRSMKNTGMFSLSSEAPTYGELFLPELYCEAVAPGAAKYTTPHLRQLRQQLLMLDPGARQEHDFDGREDFLFQLAASHQEPGDRQLTCFNFTEPAVSKAKCKEVLRRYALMGLMEPGSTRFSQMGEAVRDVRAACDREMDFGASCLVAAALRNPGMDGTVKRVLVRLAVIASCVKMEDSSCFEFHKAVDSELVQSALDENIRRGPGVGMWKRGFLWMMLGLFETQAALTNDFRNGDRRVTSVAGIGSFDTPTCVRAMELISKLEGLVGLPGAADAYARTQLSGEQVEDVDFYVLWAWQHMIVAVQTRPEGGPAKAEAWSVGSWEAVSVGDAMSSMVDLGLVRRSLMQSGAGIVFCVAMDFVYDPCALTNTGRYLTTTSARTLARLTRELGSDPYRRLFGSVMHCYQLPEQVKREGPLGGEGGALVDVRDMGDMHVPYLLDQVWPKPLDGAGKASGGGDFPTNGLDVAVLLVKHVISLGFHKFSRVDEAMKQKLADFEAGNPILRYAWFWVPVPHDGDGDDDRKRVEVVQDMFMEAVAGVDWGPGQRTFSFEDLIESKLMLQTLWCRGIFLLYFGKACFRKIGSDRPWRLTQLYNEHEHNLPLARKSLVEWDGKVSLDEEVASRFGTARREETGMETLVVANDPLFIRVRYAPADESCVWGFDDLRCLVLRSPVLDTEGHSIVDFSKVSEGYILVAVVRLRARPDEDDLIRLWDASQARITLEGSSEMDWRVGEPGYSYMLYYSRTDKDTVDDPVELVDFNSEHPEVEAEMTMVYGDIEKAKDEAFFDMFPEKKARQPSLGERGRGGQRIGLRRSLSKGASRGISRGS